MTLPADENSSRVTLPKTLHEAPLAAHMVGRMSPEKMMSVSVIVRRRKPLDLPSLGGRILSHEEFNRDYGADPEEFAEIRAFAERNGLSVDEAATSLPRRTIVLRGTVQAMEKAFGVQLEEYEGHERKEHFHAYRGTIHLPSAHAEIIQAVLGLDARPVARSHMRILDPRQAAAARSFTPMQVAKLYSYPTGVDGSGQCIGIIELGGGYSASDLQTYFGSVGLATPAVTSVSVDGGTNAPGGQADGEVALDIEVAGAIAPGAKIAVYFTPNTDQGFTDAITTAVHDTTNKPSVISISWGGPESSWSQSSLTALDDACQSAGALGVTITVASGDNGSTDGTGSDTVDFPASSPHVLACGGTQLTASGSSIATEVVWNDQASGGGATGGGVSAVFALPSWQANAGVPAPSGSGRRGVPDVAGDAAPSTGYNIYFQGQQQVVGGTSAVAPLWAALIALINQQKGSPVGFTNPTLYQNPNAFHDITQGNNGSFSAGPGWDACTGLGSPKGSSVSTALGG